MWEKSQWGIWSINKQQIYQQFGSLSAVGITPQDYDYPSDSPRTLDEYTSYTVKTDTVIEKGTNRELDEIQVCHASADRSLIWMHIHVNEIQLKLLKGKYPKYLHWNFLSRDLKWEMFTSVHRPKLTWKTSQNFTMISYEPIHGWCKTNSQ